MMWHMHVAMGASSIWLVIPLVPVDDLLLVAALLALAVIGALTPDLDAVESKIKHVRQGSVQPLVPVAKAINRKFGHRGMLHSLRGCATWPLLILPLSMWLGVLLIAALFLGYANHLMGDAGSWTGIPLLYPKRKLYHLLSKRLLVTTGLEWQELFFVAFALFSIVPLVSRPRV